MSKLSLLELGTMSGCLVRAEDLGRELCRHHLCATLVQLRTQTTTPGQYCFLLSIHTIFIHLYFDVVYCNVFQELCTLHNSTV